MKSIYIDPFLEYLFHSPSTVTYFTRRHTATYDLSVRFFSIFAPRHRGRGHSETFKHDFTVRTPPRAPSKRVPILRTKRDNVDFEMLNQRNISTSKIGPAICFLFVSLDAWFSFHSLYKNEARIVSPYFSDISTTEPWIRFYSYPMFWINLKIRMACVVLSDGIKKFWDIFECVVTYCRNDDFMIL